MSSTALETEVFERLRGYDFEPLRPLGIGYSGGADSTALAQLLFRFRQEYGFSNPVYLLYVRHNLRDKSETSIEERLIVANAIKLQMPLYVVEGSWKGIDGGLEEKARIYRYNLFRRWQDYLGLQGILTAHHKGDQDETMVLDFFSGAGWRASVGIPEIRPPYYRPLLEVGKDRLIDYLKLHNLKWSRDSSNGDESIPRNFFRARILPEVAKHIPSMNENLYRSRRKTRLLEDWVREVTDGNRWRTRNPGEVVLDIEGYLSQPPFLRYELLLSGLNALERSTRPQVFRPLYASKTTRRRRVSFAFLEPVIFAKSEVFSPQFSQKFQGFGLIVSIAGQEIILRDELEFSQINGYGFNLDESTEEPISGGWILGPEAWSTFRSLGGQGQELLLPGPLSSIRCESVLRSGSKNPIPRSKNISILSLHGEEIVRIESSDFGNLQVRYTNPSKTSSHMGTVIEKCGVVSWMEYTSE
jgi:tRNA(Ile)-lysidine synthetase-like protein